MNITNSSRRRRDDADQEPLLTERNGGQGQNQDVSSSERKWNIVCAAYFAIVLIVGISLEAVRLSYTSACELYFGNSDWLWTFNFADERELPTYLYGIACMILAVAWVLVDLAMWLCSAGERQSTSDQTGAYESYFVISDFHGGIRRSRMISLSLILLGLSALGYMVVQCRVGFMFANCWASLCNRLSRPCHTTTVLQIYLVIKCVFIAKLLLYFILLMGPGFKLRARLTNSPFNVVMAHHMTATTLYVCMRAAVGIQRQLHDGLHP
jgi:hypothetical protein